MEKDLENKQENKIEIIVLNLEKLNENFFLQNLRNLLSQKNVEVSLSINKQLIEN